MSKTLMTYDPDNANVKRLKAKYGKDWKRVAWTLPSSGMGDPAKFHPSKVVSIRDFPGYKKKGQKEADMATISRILHGYLEKNALDFGMENLVFADGRMRPETRKALGKEFKDYIKHEADHGPKGFSHNLRKAVFPSALLGATVANWGSAMSDLDAPLGSHLKTVGKGAVIGTAAGGLLAALLHHLEKKRVAEYQSLLKDKKALEEKTRAVLDELQNP